MSKLCHFRTKSTYFNTFIFIVLNLEISYLYIIHLCTSCWCCILKRIFGPNRHNNLIVCRAVGFMYCINFRYFENTYVKVLNYEVFELPGKIADYTVYLLIYPS